jgi:hypothetical protein
MTDQHPITPPPELVEKWAYEWNTLGVRHSDATNTASYVAIRAAQWGADQQLAKDAKWLDHNSLNESHLRITPIGESLREAMRPKPPSLKEQALGALGRFHTNAHTRADEMAQDFDLICRALKAQ